jgi:hypothetical protein
MLKLFVVPQIDDDSMIFQQDGACAHCANGNKSLYRTTNSVLGLRGRVTDERPNEKNMEANHHCRIDVLARHMP